jgi:hypothetical protein
LLILLAVSDCTILILVSIKVSITNCLYKWYQNASIVFIWEQVWNRYLWVYCLMPIMKYICISYKLLFIRITPSLHFFKQYLLFQSYYLKVSVSLNAIWYQKYLYQNAVLWICVENYLRHFTVVVVIYCSFLCQLWNELLQTISFYELQLLLYCFVLFIANPSN